MMPNIALSRSDKQHCEQVADCPLNFLVQADTFRFALPAFKLE
jgi:hypothetical protein